ncbi:MAG: hypothetical protein GY820_22885 [Gammaproteobacteria bacterium]|nr:hypothetical protein [Gammaproteobacteria bacterium]
MGRGIPKIKLGIYRGEWDKIIPKRKTQKKTCVGICVCMGVCVCKGEKKENERRGERHGERKVLTEKIEKPTKMERKPRQNTCAKENAITSHPHSEHTHSSVHRSFARRKRRPFIQERHTP